MIDGQIIQMLCGQIIQIMWLLILLTVYNVPAGV